MSRLPKKASTLLQEVADQEMPGSTSSLLSALHARGAKNPLSDAGPWWDYREMGEHAADPDFTRQCDERWRDTLEIALSMAMSDEAVGHGR